MPALRTSRLVLACCKLTFWPFVLLTLVAVALQLGAWRKEVSIGGPFAAETDPPQQSLILAVPDDGVIPWWRQPLIGDTAAKPLESGLRVLINGRAVGPPHSERRLIRIGETPGYSHWGASLIFSLPRGVANSPATVVTLRYDVRPRVWVTGTLLICCVFAGGILYRRTLVSGAPYFWRYALSVRRHALPITSLLLKASYLLMAGLCCLALLCSAVFICAALAALEIGWALPTTAPVRWFRAAEQLARGEPYWGYLLLTVAGLGALTTWLSALNGKADESFGYELKLRKFLRIFGVSLSVCVFLFCASGTWSGMVRPGDLHSANIGGLVPYSDAQNHVDAAFDQAKEGVWAGFAQRRPIAAAFRSVLLFLSNYSLIAMLSLQVCLVAIAAFLASYAIVAWRGIWAGLAFFALTYIYARTFAPTTLSEPLGLFWSLLSVPLFVEAFRSGSIKAAIAGFAMTTAALMVRMGSMFTIPALLLWLVWQFGKSARDKVRIGALAIGILLCVFGLNSMLQNTYGSSGGETGSNFSYVLCGLTLGTTWVGCPAQLDAQGTPLHGDEVAVSNQLYALAWRNFLERPEVFVARIKGGLTTFLQQFPEVMLKGYGVATREPAWFFPKALVAVVLAGLLFALTRRAGKIEAAFWGLLWSSIFASSSLIYFDDGARTLAVSQPLMALFFASGAINPALHERCKAENARLVRSGFSGLIVAAVLLACVPWLAHQFPPTGTKLEYLQEPKQGEAFVFGGKEMVGFLVVADEQPFRSDVPTIHLKDFKAVTADAGIENLLGPMPLVPPFGFVYAPRLERHVQTPSQFILPADVMEDRVTPAWRFRIQPLQPNSSQWFRVMEAEPWPQRTPN